ncbi:MAG TPA: FixH family protein, partial [Xanthomonadales bacterium]|nr:FixH family protein [Xanthomonadales bacterium]
MNLPAANGQQHPDFRPWYREPWVWLLIALPAIAVIGCAITIWLALSRPDHLVMDQQQYQQLEADLHAREAVQATAGQDPAAAGQ